MDNETLQKLEALGITPQEIVDREEGEIFFADLESLYNPWTDELGVLRKLGLWIAGKENMEKLVEGVASEAVGPFRVRIGELDEIVIASDEKISFLIGQIKDVYKPQIRHFRTSLEASRTKLAGDLVILRSMARYALETGKSPTNFDGFYKYVEHMFSLAEEDPLVKKMGFKEYRIRINELISSGLICYTTNGSGFHHIGIPLFLSVENSVRTLFETDYFESISNVNKTISKISEEFIRQIRFGDRYEATITGLEDDLKENEKKLDEITIEFEEQREELETLRGEKSRADSLQSKVTGLEAELALVKQDEPDLDVMPVGRAYLVSTLGLYQQMNRRNPHGDELIKFCIELCYGGIDPSETDGKYQQLGGYLEGLIGDKVFFQHPDKKIAFNIPRHLRNRRY